MSNETFVVAYEGDDTSVVDYAAERAKKDGARLHVLHVLEWSPYSFLTPQELEERHKRRQEELKRADQMLMQPVLARLRAQGVEADGELRYGSVVDLILKVTKECGGSMIFCGRAGSSSLGSRLFGSVAIGLAQSATVPTVIVP